MNYESGATEPPPSYLQALRNLGFDDRYVQTGIRGDQVEAQSHAAESLLLSICSALHIPLEMVHDAARTAAGGATHAELQREIAALLGASPVVNTANKVLVLDRDILVDIVDGLDRALVALNKTASSLQKAHAVASLYRICAERGEVDQEMVEACARSIPGA